MAGLHMKDMPGLIRDGVNKVMRGYQQIKSNANPNIFGQAAKKIGEATGTSRSGAPLPNKGRPTR